MQTVGTLEIAVRQDGNFTWPLENPKLHLRATNNGSSAVVVSFAAAIEETGQEVPAFPQPNTLFLAAGEAQEMSAILDAATGELSNLPYNVVTTRTVVWNFSGQGTVETPVSVLRIDVDNPGAASPSAMRVSGRVVDIEGNPLAASIQAKAGSGQSTTGTDQSGTFTLTLPQASNWVVRADVAGYQSGYLFLDHAGDVANQVITLSPRDDADFTYGTAIVGATGNIGFWQGTLSPDERSLLLPQGMEIWHQDVEAYRTEAKLFLYSIGGDKQWEYAMGYEAWGADLSPDSNWAVAAAKDPLHPKLILLDGASGEPVWEKALSVENFPSAAGFSGHQSNELRFSPDGNHIAIGTGEGDLYLVERTSGDLEWSVFLRGQVRALIFSPEGAALYAGAGDGNLYKLAAADGSVLWQTPIGSGWPLLEGMKLSPDKSMIGVMTKAGEVTVIDAADGSVFFFFDTAGIGQWLDFSGDSQVVVASSFGGTYGLVAATGARLFRLDGAKSGRFARDQGYFVYGGSPAAVYNSWGTQISDVIKVSATELIAGGQFSWISADGASLVFAMTDVRQPGSPILYTVSGAETTTGCGTTLSPELRLSLPQVAFNGAYYQAELAYLPSTDGALWFALAAATSTSSSPCSDPATLTASSTGWQLFIPSVEYGAGNYWAELEYLPASGNGQMRFKLLRYGAN